MEVCPVLQIKVDSACDPIQEEKDKEEENQEVCSTSDDHLGTLKALTEKLRLETRRPSYLEWKARLEAQSARRSVVPQEQLGLDLEESTRQDKHKETDLSSGQTEHSLPSGTLKGFENIDEAIIWLRKELVRPKHIVALSSIYVITIQTPE